MEPSAHCQTCFTYPRTQLDDWWQWPRHLIFLKSIPRQPRGDRRNLPKVYKTNIDWMGYYIDFLKYPRKSLSTVLQPGGKTSFHRFSSTWILSTSIFPGEARKCETPMFWPHASASPQVLYLSNTEDTEHIQVFCLSDLCQRNGRGSPWIIWLHLIPRGSLNWVQESFHLPTIGIICSQQFSFSSKINIGKAKPPLPESTEFSHSLRPTKSLSHGLTKLKFATTKWSHFTAFTRVLAK